MNEGFLHGDGSRSGRAKRCNVNQIHPMALNIKNVEVERLAAELAQIWQTSKTEAIQVALLELRERTMHGLSGGGREERLRHFLESAVWPLVPEGVRRAWTKEEEDAALGYGPDGLPL